MGKGRAKMGYIFRAASSVSTEGRKSARARYPEASHLVHPKHNRFGLSPAVSRDRCATDPRRPLLAFWGTAVECRRYAGSRRRLSESRLFLQSARELHWPRVALAVYLCAI